jgi:uncharacterized protein (TIGR03435 family)
MSRLAGICLPRIVAVLIRATLAQSPAFDVASVKLQAWTGQGGVGVFVRGGTLDAEHASLRDLVEFAYNLRDVQLSGGPAWADRSNSKLNDAELYQVIGKVSGDAPPSTDMFRRMLQTLLAQRFALKVHHLQKDLPVYNLTIDKGGVKFERSAAEAKFTSQTSMAGRTVVRMVNTQMTMEKLASMLGGYAGRPVYNKTNLDGDYDFTLQFATVNLADAGDAPAEGPSLFTALREQLGLKLEPALAPFDTVVIDHAERPS